MKRILLVISLSIFSYSIAFAQKKTELLAEIENLKTELDSTKALVIDARKNEKVGLAKAESFEVQVTELQEANATLLKNLNNFAAVSSKNSDNINKTLATLESKEKQLKSIKDGISSNDSTAIVVLTNAKQSLGENAKVGVKEGAIVISENSASVFGNATAASLSPAGQTWAQQVASILTVNPTMNLTVEIHSTGTDLNSIAAQSAALGTALVNASIAPDRLRFTMVSGQASDMVHLKMHPKFKQFYLGVREEMKNSN